MGVRAVFGSVGVRVGRRVVTALRDRLVRDVIFDLVRDETLTAWLVLALGINPRADTMGDLEAGRAVLAWAREGRDVYLDAGLVRDGDGEAVVTSVDVSSPLDPDAWRKPLRGAVVPNAETPTRGILDVIDLIAEATA